MNSLCGQQQTRILVIEDDATVSEVVVRYLEREGYQADSVTDGETALERIETFKPDLVVLDVMLPQLNGFDVCSRLKPRGLPVIMLTARGEESDKIMGLDLGADDYIVKPFSPRELIARIRAVLRRSNRAASGADAPARIQGGDLEIDPRSRSVLRGGEVISVTAREYELLLFLMQNPGRVFRREELLAHVWGYTFGGTPTVTVHVQRLRQKIEHNPERPVHIATVWGAGYRFDP